MQCSGVNTLQQHQIRTCTVQVCNFRNSNETMKSYICILLLCISLPACLAGYCNDTDLVVVSGVSAGWFDRLENLVGSIHFWSPTVKLEIYDLGMTMQQREQVSSWKNTVLLNLQQYLEHEEYQIHRLWTYAFKPVIIHEALQRHKVPRTLHFCNIFSASCGWILEWKSEEI